MHEIDKMCSTLMSRISSTESKFSVMNPGYNTLPILEKMGPINSDKQFINYIKSPCVQKHQRMDQPVETYSSQQTKPVTKNPPTNNQGCSNKKKRKKRKRRKKKNKINQPQEKICMKTTESSTVNNSHCHRQRQISTTESEDSFIIFFDDTLDVDEHISELSENETVIEDFDSSDSLVPHKKVRFANDSALCEVHPMVMWSYAYQAARKGPWEEYARDRDRFLKRVENIESNIGHVFHPEHRSRVYKERFSVECSER